MSKPHFTARDLLAIENPDLEDPFATQLLQSYRDFLWDILNREGKPRQFTKEEYRVIALFLAAHHGNPYGFALSAALRTRADVPIAFVTQASTERMVAGDFDEQDGTFREPPWLPEDDPLLRVSHHRQQSFYHWMVTLPMDYPHRLVLETPEGEQTRFYVMYRPHIGATLLPGVFLPYDATYTLLPPQRLHTNAYVVQKLRLLQQPGYLLSLGTFAQFAIEAFPILCPAYRIPELELQEGENILELFLRACYGKHFSVGSTTFRAEDDDGISGRGLPDWAQRWMVLWRELPPGAHIGKEEVLALLDLLWNVPMDAQSILSASLDNWLYGALYGPREGQP